MKWILPVVIVAGALVGVLLGFWKIDTYGLIFLAVGSYFILRPGLWKFVGIGMIVFGLALWFDWIGISGGAW